MVAAPAPDAAGAAAAAATADAAAAAAEMREQQPHVRRRQRSLKRQPEEGDGVGGTWYHNRYPGCAVDLPSFFYSFSFEKKYDWTRPYAPQPELLAYMEGIAEKYALLPHCRFGQQVEQVGVP